MHDNGFVLSLIKKFKLIILVCFNLVKGKDWETYFAIEPLHCFKYSIDALLLVLNMNKKPSACLKSWVCSLFPNLQVHKIKNEYQKGNRGDMVKRLLIMIA